MAKPAAFRGCPPRGASRGRKYVDKDVKIREILVSDSPPEDEFVKIHNSGAENVDLTGWVLQDSRRHPEHPYIFHFPHTVLNPTTT